MAEISTIIRMAVFFVIYVLSHEKVVYNTFIVKDTRLGSSSGLYTWWMGELIPSWIHFKHLHLHCPNDVKIPQSTMVSSRGRLTLRLSNIPMENHHFLTGKTIISMAMFNRKLSAPYAQCMIYLPTFGWFLGWLLAHIPAPWSTWDRLPEARQLPSGKLSHSYGTWP